jgi:flagellar basal body rod protein FlgF
MAAKSDRKAKKAGRKINPGSLRQSGRLLQIRIPDELHERAHAKAGDEGLSAVVRRLLEAWLAR